MTVSVLLGNVLGSKAPPVISTDPNMSSESQLLLGFIHTKTFAGIN